MQGYSTGCLTCRKRKVKCDEAKPECERCKRRGETCLGYRDKTQWTFKSMNAGLARKATYLNQSQNAGLSTLHASKSASATLARSSSLVHQPAPGWEQYAIASFFHNYALSPTQGRRGYLEFLPDLFARNEHELALKHAVLAVSAASFGNVHNSDEVRTKAQKHYGLALRAAQRNVSEAVSAKNDHSLASIVLLQLFEILNGLKDSDVDYHDEALTRIQQLRTEQEQRTPIGLQLALVIQSQRLMSEFGGGRLYSAPITQICLSGPQRVTPAITTVWHLIPRISRMNHQIQEAMVSSTYHVQLDTVFEEAFEVYTELDAWPQSVPEKDQYRNMPATATQSSLVVYPSVHHTFDSVQHSGIWIGFWCAEIQFLQKLLMLIGKFGTSQTIETWSTTFTVENITGRLIAAVDHICGSAQYALGNRHHDAEQQPQGQPKALGALFLLRGLHVATQVETITSDQRAFLFDCLSRIGHEKGIVLALRCRDRWVYTHNDDSHKR